MSDEAAEADALADLVNRWRVDRMDPERFHLDRDEIAKRLRRLARRLRGETRPAPTTTWRPDALRADVDPSGRGAGVRPRGPDRYLRVRGELT